MMTETTRALVARLAELLSNERVAIADFIITLADFDRQRRWAEAGYANLFDFLVRELGMSRGTAFYRKTAVAMPAAASVLDLGHEANRLARPNAGATTPAHGEGLTLSISAPALPSPRTAIEPLTGQDRRLHVTVTPEFLKLLDACRDALSHALPGASDADILEEGMRLILAKDAKKKALVAKPRSAKDPQLLRFDTRYIPAEIRRAVWKRDQGRCQWPLENGGLCGSTCRPELDHLDGFQPGKPITAEDLRVCCAPHNQEHARQVFGDAYMAQFRRRRARFGSAHRGAGAGDVSSAMTGA